tara:strand:+ start:634 stop:933 length:300 start_codon:yes stop_codon:yes gene_type:complete
MSKQGHSQEQIDRKLQSIERWKDTITRYKKEIQKINDRINPYDSLSQDDIDRLDWNKLLIHNNIQIAEHNIRVLESTLMIDKLRKENYKIKISHKRLTV